jgi:hypothetical protein
MARAISLLLLLAGVVHLQQASALYHTSSEVLHWFKQWSTKRSDLLRCGSSTAQLLWTAVSGSCPGEK